MVIRAEQILTMQSLVATEFRYRVTDYVLANCFVPTISADVLDRRIRFGIARAREYRFTTEQAITAFVAIMFNVGPNFDDQVRINTILADISVPDTERIQLIVTGVSATAWAAAARARGDEVWPDTGWRE